MLLASLAVAPIASGQTLLFDSATNGPPGLSAQSRLGFDMTLVRGLGGFGRDAAIAIQLNDPVTPAPAQVMTLGLAVDIPVQGVPYAYSPQYSQVTNSDIGAATIAAGGQTTGIIAGLGIPGAATVTAGSTLTETGGFTTVSYNSAGTILTANTIKHQGANQGDRLGWSIAAIDREGDSRLEFLVGAPQGGGGGSGIGYVQAFDAFGEPDGIISGPNTPGAKFGSSMAVIEDINADGTPDFVVGAPGANGAAGALYFYSGKSLGYIFDVPGTGTELLGNVVHNVGDVNGDGFGDVAAQSFVGGTSITRVRVFSGQGGAVLHDITNPVPAPLVNYGYVVCGGEDVNGDGKDDFAIADSGGPFLVRIYDGATGGLITAVRAPAVPGPIARVSSMEFGDFDGDGVVDLFMGRDLALGGSGQLQVYSTRSVAGRAFGPQSFTNETGGFGSIAAVGSRSISSNNLAIESSGFGANRNYITLVTPSILSAPASVSNFTGDTWFGVPRAPLPPSPGLLSADGSATVPVDLSGPIGSIPVLAGTSYYFQTWYVDGPNGAVKLSHHLVVTLTP